MYAEFVMPICCLDYEVYIDVLSAKSAVIAPAAFGRDSQVIAGIMFSLIEPVAFYRLDLYFCLFKYYRELTTVITCGVH